jgi:alkylation response protein AidB-like acyl-CoA dehydrogenase
MNFALTEDQGEIKRVAHELLSSRSPWPRVREHAESGRYDDGLWRELCELGWPGIAVSAAHGGQDLGMVELAALAEELGYACAAVPFAGTASVAAALSAAGSPEQIDRLLPGLIAGETQAGVGPAGLLADGGGAQVLIVLDGDQARLVEGRAEPLTTVDSTRSYGAVGDAGGERLGEGAGDRIRVVLAAEVLGLCQRALEMTLEYVKDRKQFGVPVGSFQAVSHRCAQMLLHTESVRSTVYFAAWAADAEAERLPEAAALAAAAAVEAGREVTASAIQAHGGIGFTWEADVHWLYKRAQLDAAVLGGAKDHRVKLAQLAAERLAVPAR